MARKILYRQRTVIRRTEPCEKIAHTGVSSHERESQISVLLGGSGAKLTYQKYGKQDPQCFTRTTDFLRRLRDWNSNSYRVVANIISSRASEMWSNFLRQKQKHTQRKNDPQKSGTTEYRFSTTFSEYAYKGNTGIPTPVVYRYPA